MKSKSNNFIKCTNSAKKKIQEIIKKNNNPKLKFRVYITGGGCSGFQYQFIFDEKKNKNDIIIMQSNISLIIDGISLQYLHGGTIDYLENLEGSRFVIVNPHAKSTCSCGVSFSI